ncbi:MAG: 3-isopropylmalate dehydrogenase [Chloroflexi bacterium]|nr:3-isopropylmalate dehydrogenase [Chloroflexota bacterium]MDA1296407.1 3-isopropylmalate dehydrogenase [Chloroflexota bacterium]
MEARITVLGGDGIGPEVTAESMKVIDAVGRRYGHRFDWVPGIVGGRSIDERGTAIDNDTLNLVLGADAVLFGAVGGPKWDNPLARIRPEDGILKLRKTLGLFANLRPVKVYPQLIDSSPLRPERLKGVDFVIIRELTGGLYFGKPKRRWENTRGRRAVDTLSYTEKEIQRVVRVGFELARMRRKRLHSLDKMNVMETSRLWREVATEVGHEYPDVELIHMLADNAAMQIVTNPIIFDVIVTENTFGDILSDEAAVIGGSMGMLPSASLSSIPKLNGRRRRGGKPALYEPIHGSAPDIAGRGIANPLASILSAAMMLRWSFGLHDEANAVEGAVEGFLAEGYRTADIADAGTPALPTVKVGDMIAAYVSN